MAFEVDKFWQQLTNLLIVKALPGKWRNLYMQSCQTIKR